MRALLTALLLLAAPAAAAAKPLDADSRFARNGVFRMDEPRSSQGLIALAAGGTLHATNGAGLLRLGDRGRRVGSAFLDPAGSPEAIVPAAGGALVAGVPGVAYGTPTPLGVWRVDRDGRTLAHHAIDLPGGRSAHPLRLVRRGDRAFALAGATHPERSGRRLVVVALNGNGELDAAWGDGGFRTLAAGDSAGIAVSPRDGSLLVAQALQTRCDRLGYTRRKERARLRVIRFDVAGAPRWRRTHTLGARDQCPLADVGDVVDEGRRVVLGGGFGRSTVLLGLRRDGRRDRRFGRRGVVSPTTREHWTPVQVVRRRGGYAFAHTDGDGNTPHAYAGLVDRRGRNLRHRRLRTSRLYPNSAVHDIAIDRRGGLVAAGQLFDTDLFIREDYGQPHLAAWRLRTR